MKLLKRILYSAYCLISISMLCSCQKVIEVNAGNNTESKYVIEAVVTDEHGDCGVSISKTKNLSDKNSFVGIDGATVTLEGGGTVRTIPPSGHGLYQAANIVGTPGVTYTLTINVEGHVFTSVCKMPPAVTFKDLYIITGDSQGRNNDSNEFASVSYKDPAKVKNYYRFVQYVNTVREKTIFIANDEFSDGQDVNRGLDFTNDNDDPARDIISGSQVTVEMLCIDSAVYKYWFGLRDGASGSSNNAAPSNPVSNIKGGALGYFSVHTIQRRTISAP